MLQLTVSHSRETGRVTYPMSVSREELVSGPHLSIAKSLAPVQEARVSAEVCESGS